MSKRPVLQWVYRAKVIRWVDGDTVDVMIDRGFKDYSMRRLRLQGIDTPEIRGVSKEEKERGEKATIRAEELAPVDSEVIIETHKSGKFGRWVAKIWPNKPIDWSINEILIMEGLAKKY